VLESFAKHAPEDARIVIKNHLLDKSLRNFTCIIRACGRIVYWDGDLVSLVRHAEGVVTLNSTVSLMALKLGAPTLTLGGQMDNVPGLTIQDPLDDCWMSRHPDAGLFGLFRWVVMQETQVKGGFIPVRVSTWRSKTTTVF
jgi:capsular polysaccharide export protein